MTAWLALLFAALAGPAAAAPWAEPYRVQLLTVAPGSVYWERYGHNAIVITPPGAQARSYNYGIFDFRQRNFLLRFILGRMLYQVAAYPTGEELARYDAQQRPWRLQTLGLNAAEKARLIEFLRRNVQPENAHYRYDYFLANCSTRVRDALDVALQGALANRFDPEPAATTYRQLARAYAAPVRWLDVGSHLGLGRPVDRPISRWQSFFIPDELADALDQVRRSDGSSLVTAVETHRGNPERAVAPAGALHGAAVGVLLAGVIVLTRRRRWVVPLFLGVVGTVGTALALLHATDHWAAHWNENVLLFSPLALLVAIRRFRARAVSGAMDLGLLWALPAAALVAFLLPGGQDNVLFVTALVPPLAAASVVLRRAVPA